jgi:hypothetical protein
VRASLQDGGQRDLKKAQATFEKNKSFFTSLEGSSSKKKKLIIPNCHQKKIFFSCKSRFFVGFPFSLLPARSSQWGLSLNPAQGRRFKAVRMSLEDDIKTTQEILQPLINKPVLKDKLLQKPPFRFIHDIFSQVTVATGFGEGLFEDRNELLDGKGIKDKQGKLGEYVNLYACFTLLCYQFHSDPPKA